jgi:CheY-like chemotaxis protein
MRVLYVEDNPANVFLVKRVARMGNHEIINYIDGAQAIKKFEEIKPDLVLMDLQLSGDMDGLEAVKMLRDRGIQTPIIAVTAYAMVGDRERCIEAGCTDYMPKPLPIQRLVEIFEYYHKQSIAGNPDATGTVDSASAAQKDATPVAESSNPSPEPTSDPVSSTVEPEADKQSPEPASNPVSSTDEHEANKQSPEPTSNPVSTDEPEADKPTDK